MKIILATDGTSYSDAAAQMLCKFDVGPDDEIIVVSVIDMAVPMAVDIYGGYLPDTTMIEETARNNAKQFVERTANLLKDAFKAKNVPVNTDILFGSPDSRIVEMAEKTGAELIVIGSHGYNRWERLLLGSISNSVVHHAPCSVMVVRSNDPSQTDDETD